MVKLRFLVRLIGIVLWIGAIPGAAAGAAVPRLETLENGLRVVLLEDHSSPLAAAAVWIHVGGKNETEDVVGFSHFLEHLIPQGTQGRAPRQEQLEIFRAGGISRIQADYDRTYFFVEVDSSALEVSLRSLLQQVARASLDQAAIERIRPVLRQRLASTYQDPSYVLFLEQMRAAFPEDPYRFPYQGSFTSLDNLEAGTADAFYANFYVPNNMVLAIGGDIESEKALSLSKKLFGSLKPSKTLPPPPGFVEPGGGPRQIIKRLDRMEPCVSVLFPTPGFRHPDRYALAALSRLLGDPHTSPVIQKLDRVQDRVLSFSSKFHLLEERGLLAITAFPVGGRGTPDLGKWLVNQLNSITQQGLGEEEVGRTVRQLQLQETIRRDAIGPLVQDLAEAALFDDLRSGWDLEANLKHVDASEMNRVARRYLTADNLVILIIHPVRAKELPNRELNELAEALETLGTPPPDSPPEAAPSEKRPKPEERARLQSRGAQAPASKTERVILPNGLTLLLKPHPRRGLVATSLHVQAGSAYDPRGKEGISQMVASALSLGPKTSTAEAFRDRVASTGAAFGVSASLESVEAGLIVFPSDLPLALDLLAQAMLSPDFAETRLEAMRERIRRFATAEEASPDEVARALLREKIYRGHPYARPPVGAPGVLKEISKEDLTRFHGRYYRPDRAVLTLVGEFESSRARRMVSDAFAAWKKPGEDPPSPLPKEATSDSLSGEFSRRVDTGLPQVAVGYPGVPLNHPDFPLLRALGSVLSARGFLDLVLGNPLANFVSATPEGLGQGGMLFVGAGAGAASASRLAYELMLQARALGVKEVTPATVQDLIRIERGRVAREKASLYTLASNLGYYELLGAGYAEYDEKPPVPPDLTPKRLKEAASKYLDAARQVRIIVEGGPR